MKISGFSFRVLFLILFIFPGLQVCGNEIFLKFENIGNDKNSTDLKKIESAIGSPRSEYSGRAAEEGNWQIIDYFKKNENEYFFRTDDGFYYASVEEPQVLIDRLFLRNLEQIEPENRFIAGEKEYILFRNGEMRNGIYTEWYSVLDVSFSSRFHKDDFYQMWGFSRDEDESGENGIEIG